jgi:hypothetical protein
VGAEVVKRYALCFNQAENAITSSSSRKTTGNRLSAEKGACWPAWLMDNCLRDSRTLMSGANLRRVAGILFIAIHEDTA